MYQQSTPPNTQPNSRSRSKKVEEDKPIFDFNSDKILDAIAVGMRDDARLIVFEGTVRSAKTTTAIELLHLRIKFKMTAKYAMIACEDYDAVRDNILEAKTGLLAIQPEEYELMRSKIGGYFVSVKGTDKHILICGYSNASKWKKILGKDLEIIMVDEANNADERFMEEALTRQGATESPFMILTLNGDDPALPLYENIINKCVIVGDCPASTRAMMAAVQIKKRGYFYFHWTFDDNPALTPEMKKTLRHQFPVGSYYHKIKILGERGKWGSLIFADYMSPDLITDLYITDPKTGARRLDPKYNITRFVLGVDIAESRATNVFSLVGFDSTYSRAFLVDLEVFKSSEGGMKVGYAKKTAMLKAFLARNGDKVIECISLDSAEGNYIQDLKGEGLGIEVIPSYKATIKQRIDLNIILFSKRRFLFDIRCIQAFQAYQNSVWVKGKEGKEREDSNLPMNDMMDATEYAETVHMKTLSYAAERLGVA
jgi:PBSX family phage terminase large subunit